MKLRRQILARPRLLAAVSLLALAGVFAACTQEGEETDETGQQHLQPLPYIPNDQLK